MKNTRRCPKCQCNRILYIATVADSYDARRSTPMKIAHYEKPVGTMLGIPMVSTGRAGELEAGVCSACGYTEFYTKSPHDIIVDGVNVRELVADEPAKP